MKNNTNESTDVSNIEVTAEDVKSAYTKDEVIGGVIKHPNGGFYRILPRDLTTVMLSLVQGKQVVECAISMLLERIVNNDWTFYDKNDNSWIPPIEYPKEVIDFKNNVVKQIIYNQLAIDNSDKLIGTIEEDKYTKNLLLKANKGLERKASNHLKNFYGTNPEMLINLFEAIDVFVSKISNKLPHEFFYLNAIIDEYDEDPTKFHGKKVKFQKLNDGKK